MPDTTNKTSPSGWRRYLGLPRNVLALSAVSLLNDTSSEIIYPLLPAFLALSLGASPFAIGLIEGFAESTASLLKLFSGYLSDRFKNRKLPVFVGYALAAVTRPFLAFASSWPQVLLVRVSDRAGKGIRGAPRDALLADSVPEKERGFAYGFNRAADNMGAVLGPIFAFLLLWLFAANANAPTVHEYQRVFLFASIPVVLGLLVIVFFVRERHHVEHHDADPVKLSLAGYDANFKRFLITISLFTLSNSTDAFLLLRAVQAGIAPVVVPLLWMVLNVSKVVFSLIGGNLSDKVGRKIVIIAGWTVYALVYLGFAFVTTPWECWVLFVIYGVYFGLSEGVEKAFVADMVPARKRGTAFGLYNLAFGITVFPASLLFGLAWNTLGAPIAFIASGAVSLAAIALLTTVKAQRQEEKAA